MTENQLLHTTLEILNEQGAAPAYGYLVQHQNTVTTPNRSQIYNFLYCLAAVSGHTEEALSWLEEAILGNKYWYRPEVFEDSDLDSLREEERFVRYQSLSEERYLEAETHAKTLCSWKAKTSDKLLVALHGNQQNSDMCKGHWLFLNIHGYQVETLQSRELDSYELYRWEDEGDGKDQLGTALVHIGWDNYSTRVLGGFSAGCNVILKLLMDDQIDCDHLILQSPWIPVVNSDLDKLLETLKKRHIKVLMICSHLDEDCAPLAQTFYEQASAHQIDMTAHWIDGSGHDFPENFESLVADYLHRS